MIGAYIDGRLGNQFFRYAFARMVRYERGEIDDMVLNFNSVYAQSDQGKDFENELRYFNVLPFKSSTANLYLTLCSKTQIIIFRGAVFSSKFTQVLYPPHSKKAFNLLDRMGFLLSRDKLEDSSFNIPRCKTVITSGRFEIPEYYYKPAIRSILLNEFTPKQPLIERNIGLYKQICNSNSICVTIRRGDYLSSKFVNNYFLCDSAYFQKAIQVAKEKVENPLFVFFSDDINWVRNNIKLESPCLYESGLDPVWEKIRLMSACKHFIISNSTFSWWAQYLSRNENKIVISPSRWYANLNWKSNLIMDNFIKIKTKI